MALLKKILAVLVLLAFILTAYLFAPLVTARYSARSSAIDALKWVDDSLQGSALQRAVYRRLLQEDLPGEITSLEVVNDHGKAKLTFSYDHRIALGSKLITTIPIEIEVSKKMLHRRDAR